MNFLDMTIGRTTYEIELAHSILFECALGIAAITYPEIHPTLEKPVTYWQQVKDQITSQLKTDLAYCERHNTWKSLLQLLHQQNFTELESFIHYIQHLSDEDLRYFSLPFIGWPHQENRRKASQVEPAATEALIAACRNHKFFPSYIRFISQVDLSELRSHLIRLIRGWHDEYTGLRDLNIQDILARDIREKQRMQKHFGPEEFVEWATGGISYQPEPTVTKVLLIPHTIYRPWTIQAESEGTKIFYYPVADESLDTEADMYRPPLSLVQRYKALGDETRLRIVKLLYERSHSLHELTEILELAKSTVHHHLAMLKSAHLVETADNLYLLKRSSSLFADAELCQYLERGTNNDKA